YNQNVTTGRLISRTTLRLGLATPAFIHNSSYFLVNLQVYEDGLVNCWELLDLKLFEKKLDEGWVVPGVPDGEDLSVHGLGNFKLRAGKWKDSPATLLARVRALVRELNPQLHNLHNCHGQTERLEGKMRVSILGSPEERRLRRNDDFRRSAIHGDHVSLLYKQQGEVFLADVRAFADGSVEIGRVPEPVVTDLDGVCAAIEKRALFTKPRKGTRVFVHGLGSFEVEKARFITGAQDMLRDLRDIVETLNGRADSSMRCRDAYEAFVADPTTARRDALRTAYEAVPEHNRMYVLRDQDVKDIPIRMIVYGDKEIENWSHRAVARARGDALPTITVPKVKDKAVRHGTTTRRAASRKGSSKKR
ncbi:MAG TPA: hypothetical protein PKA88_27030, partial [Polyangiaceae bacterium]|nr:hypothetical protein [Polyangiaceae bacterium]